MTPGEYATLGGSVLPLPPDGGTSHSQQVLHFNVIIIYKLLKCIEVVICFNKLFKSNINLIDYLQKYFKNIYHYIICSLKLLII